MVYRLPAPTNIWSLTPLYIHLESNHKLLTPIKNYSCKSQEIFKETAEAIAITIDAITQEVPRMKIGIIFLLLARTCIGDTSQECPEGWLQNLGHCFLFGSDGLGSYAEAREYCKEKGGFLAEISNEQTNTFLVDNMKRTSELQKKWWWIGANDIANVSMIMLPKRILRMSFVSLL